MDELRAYLINRFGAPATEKSLAAIDTVIITSLQAVQHTMASDAHCFEVYVEH